MTDPVTQQSHRDGRGPGQWFNLTVVTFLAVAMSVLLGRFLIQESFVLATGKESYGVVVATQFDSKHDYVRVRVDLADGPVTSELMAWKGRPEQGSRLKVRYVPAFPSIAQQSGTFPWFSATAGPTAVLVLGLIADNLWRRERSLGQRAWRAAVATRASRSIRKGRHTE